MRRRARRRWRRLAVARRFDPLDQGHGPVILLRSILFNLLFYLNTVAHLLLAMPTMVMPYRAVVGVAKMWGRTNLWLLRRTCGLDVEWRGLEKIPPGGIIVAAKHQSAWETFALL